MDIVINVDDLGLHPAVGRAVQELGSCGAVTSATALANGPFVEAVPGLDVVRSGQVGVGVHLNILRGVPLSPPAEVSTLIDGQGRFLGSFKALFLRYLRGGLDFSQVRTDWDRQIGRLKDLGIAPTHLDGEKHVHAWPGLFSLAEDLAQRHGIGWVRRPREAVSWSRPGLGTLRVLFLNTCCLGHRSRGPVGRPDLVFGIADQGWDLRPDRFASYMQGRQARVVEIVCHPGRKLAGDPPLPESFGRLRVEGQWAEECEALLNPDWAEAFRALKARLTHYGRIEPQ